ncbi:23S rRNA pseudouridine(1911/1915/1917) synthase RluD [Xanthomonadaceae bacterium JHOS43]|nr:23S rRNA pseudouridine(1911/1915/1917) synthase RluD [Xanthomonadaceae bacterium JHOS43]
MTTAPISAVATRQARVPIEFAGRRIDQVLAELFPEFSRSRLTAWIKAGQVAVDGHVPRPRDAVKGGEWVEVNGTVETATDSAPEAIALDILYEDEHLLIVNKPVGLVVHPGAGNPAGTLVNALLHHDANLALLPRAGIVHRLDKDTSGALIVARTLPAHTALVEQLASREIHRQYEAIVTGPIIAGGTIDVPLDRHPVDRLRRAVSEDGKPAVTHYRVRERFRAHTRVECVLETGRTHQIRVHMAHIRHPLVGDPLYGGSLRLPKAASDELIATLRGFRRQALHAEKVELAHPIHGSPLQAIAPTPPDLLALAAALRADTAQHADDEG